MASNDLGDWYRSIPQISKYWFTGSVILPLMGKLGLVNPVTMILDFDLVVYNFHVSKPNLHACVVCRIYSMCGYLVVYVIVGDTVHKKGMIFQCVRVGWVNLLILCFYQI